jgi:hypothetical protein
MSDNTSPDEAVVDTAAPEVGDQTTDPPDVGADAPDDVSGREKRYRLELRAQQDANAEMTGQLADVAAKLRAAERMVVDQHLSGKIRDTDPFWQSTDHSDLLDEDGNLDLARVDEHVGSLIDSKPYLAPAAPGMPAVAPAPMTEGSAGKVGFPPTGVLNVLGAEPSQSSWQEVLRGAAGEVGSGAAPTSTHSHETTN